MATDALSEEFVTIVPVGESRPAASPIATKESTFVTVLTLGAAAGAAEVVVRRPRGARLGLGLKFEGGSAATETVRRLLVQSCSEDSPAASASTPWGKLIPGDEILSIDGISVSELTRIDCVRRLKDSDEILTLLVRHFETNIENESKSVDTIDSSQSVKEITRPTTLPPPVPPRKLGKKNSFKDMNKPALQTFEQNGNVNNDLHIKESILNGQSSMLSNTMNSKLSRKSSFDSHLHRQLKESFATLKKGSPEEARRLVRRLSDGKTMPPEAEVYVDLLSTEWERCLALADAESDDTGSSISTVVDRLGSMTSSVENSIPSTPIMQPKTIDIQKVLNCIENIDTNILKDLNKTSVTEKHSDIKHEFECFEKSSSNETSILQQLTDEAVMNAKRITQNDKNNNTTVLRNITYINLDAETRKSTNKIDATEVAQEKPKPMPRNTKIERTSSEKKLKQIPLPETPPPPLPEPLLTPTKKNCIESWLQRSEAEMNSNKGSEVIPESSVPEVLPRLIDFVPKPQFKECDAPTAIARPTSAPPPPPADSREDGSGASLDTIGELDESSDVIDSQKAIVPENETKKRKASYESGFWEDRVNKSDAEDKSLSNDESPLPTCPRQPPDGVETPCDAVEKVSEALAPSRLPPRPPSGWPTTTRTRLSYTSRSQDARSEASVRDKIAMFSTDRSSSSDHLDKCGTLPSRTPSTAKKNTTPYANNYLDVSTLDRRLTKSQDNLDELPRSYKRHSERPEVLGGIESSYTVNGNAGKTNKTLHIESKPLVYGSTTTLPSSVESFAQPVYHSRSASDDSSKSVHKSNLEYLIEQRKKSMSKLRGLVIPETNGPIVDLPEIKIQESYTKSFLTTTKKSQIEYRQSSKQTTSKPFNFNDIKWKNSVLSNNIPKYSPAFKRKSLQVYTPTSLSKENSPERRTTLGMDVITMPNRMIPSKPPRTSLDVKSVTEHTTTLPSKFSVSSYTKQGNKDRLNDIGNFNNMEIKICTVTDIGDSDNDSAMSSTQSSYRSSASSPLHNLDSIESDSSRLSPRITHFVAYSIVKTEIPTKSSVIEKSCEEYVKRNVCRSVSSETNVSLSSSAGSAATSGSQASCSSLESSVADSDKRKVSKPYNIDTLNRRHILASAKCRSGRDAKLKSPVIETKFSHESDRSPSPQLKTSDRLSTLTTTVSAISNKGETRRRNKMIAETDSDSDNEVNVRQRKNDFKNSRLKRNSSANNKNKQVESNIDTTKTEDIPAVISERIIKEIKKAGLDNLELMTSKAVIDKTEYKENNNTEKSIQKKEERILTSNMVSKPRTLDVVDSNSPKSITKLVPAKDTVIVNGKSNHLKNDSITPSHVIQLKRGVGTGVGLILAGGIDCEAKEVTVHRVLADSVAAKAGLKRGARVRSINGCSMTGLTHAQSVAILKEQRMEISIEIEDERQENANKLGVDSNNAESKVRAGTKAITNGDNAASDIVTVMLEKAGGGAGLGFGLDGGRDSPHGDRPLTVKKLFAGGAAACSGRILVGAELLSAGGQSMEGFTRTQAWAALKALPAGVVALVLKNPK